ncbi:uncharacterized protein LOC134853395 [Symsagittifera roscoffensis]|uniref:uncharacterized protein LOC134853395 n=1 Tax=Symsagittifera roscoffensis TaxID=84072 RepID=UPI00307B9800
MSLDTQQILCQCCIWSVEYQDQLLPSCEDSFAVRQYKDKRNTVSDTPLTFHRNTALLDRGCLVTPSSKRSDKLKFSLPEFETLLRNQEVASFQWRTRLYVIIIFVNRTFAHVYVNSETGDLEFMFIDNSLQNKFTSDEEINDAIISEQFYVFSFRGSNRIGVISFSKQLPIFFSGSKVAKLSSFTPKLVYYDLPVSSIGGVPSNWRLFANRGHSTIVVYAKPVTAAASHNKQGRAATSSSASTTEIGTSKATNDLVVFTMSSRGVAVQTGKCYLGKEVLDLCFTESGFQTVDRDIHSSRGSYQISHVTTTGTGEPLLSEVKCLQMKGELMCCKWSPNGRLCAVSGTGKELQIFDNVTQKTTQLTHSLRVDNVHFICWHSSSVVLFLFSRKGDIQIVDVAGNEFNVALCTEKVRKVSLRSHESNSTLSLRQIFRHTRSNIHNIGSCYKIELSLLEANNRSIQPHTKILVFLERGPFIMFDFITPKFTMKNLILSRISTARNTLSNTFKLLEKLNWNEDHELLFLAISRILSRLLSRPIGFEAEDAVDRVLDLFYEPFNGGQVSEVVGEEYEHSMYHFSLKYMHSLMRTGRLEKALNVATAINSPDSCMDVCHMATDLKEFELAKVARFHAETILQSEEYDAEASCLFPKLDFNQQNEEGEGKREGGQGANQRTGSVQGQASEDAPPLFPIPSLEELQRRDVVKDAIVEEALKGLYLVNEPLGDSEDETTSEERSRTEGQNNDTVDGEGEGDEGEIRRRRSTITSCHSGRGDKIGAGTETLPKPPAAKTGTSSSFQFGIL